MTCHFVRSFPRKLMRQWHDTDTSQIAARVNSRIVSKSHPHSANGQHPLPDSYNRMSMSITQVGLFIKTWSLTPVLLILHLRFAREQVISALVHHALRISWWSKPGHQREVTSVYGSESLPFPPFLGKFPYAVSCYSNVCNFITI